MSGEAKTNDFLLTNATLMVGPSADVFDLIPTTHSLGLVKNVQVSVEQSFVELTQGVQAQVVASVNTQNTAKISAEIYEYTARNLAYGAGLDGSPSTYDPITDTYALGSAITGGPSNVTLPLGTGDGADFAAGDWVLMQTTDSDDVYVGKVASKSTDTLTMASGYPIKRSWAVATTTVYRVHSINVGGQARQPQYGIKLVGNLPESGEPCVLIFPKVKITKGINLAFQTDNFSNMPFEFTPYTLLPADAHYAEFGGLKTWKVLKR
jgi:hypothetical protein